MKNFMKDVVKGLGLGLGATVAYGSCIGVQELFIWGKEYLTRDKDEDGEKKSKKKAS